MNLLKLIFFLSILMSLWIGRIEVNATQLPKENKTTSKNTDTSCASILTTLENHYGTFSKKSPVEATEATSISTIAPIKGKAILDISFLPEDTSHQSEYWGLSQSQVNYLFKNSSDLLSIAGCDFSGKDLIKKINKKKWKEILGWKAKEVIGAPLSFLVHPDDIQTTAHAMEFSQKKVFTSGFENRVKCKDKSYRWVHWMSLGKLDIPLEEIPINRLVLWVGRDITSQKEEEMERLKAIENDQRKITSQNKILKSISQIQSAYINKEAHLPCKELQDEDPFLDHYYALKTILEQYIQLSESQYGVILEIFYDKEKTSIRKIFSTNKEFTEKSHQGPFQVYQEKEQPFCKFDDIFGQVLTTTKPLFINNSFEIQDECLKIPSHHLLIRSCLSIPLILKDEVMSVVSLMNNDNGYSEDLLYWLEPFSLSAVCIIKELKMENLRKIAEKDKIKAEVATEAKSSFLAHMSHEMRTPLFGILGPLELIQEKELSKENYNYLMAARQSGTILMSLINDVLDISKIEAHQIGLEKIELEPIQIAQETIQLFLTESQKKGITLTLTVDPLVPLRLMGDPLRFRQILTNLVSNAIKFTKKGSVSVTLKGEKSPDQDVFNLCGVVTDTGIGMTQETLKRMFKPFTQADQSIMRQFGGTGLGLYITKELCKLMGGEIEVRSEPEEGSIFQFTVKMDMPKDPFSQTKIQPIEIEKKFLNKRILIVEDNLVTQQILRKILEREGCLITTAENGKEALEKIQETKELFDLILMDGQMPEMDGLEATRRIRNLVDHERRAIPIIGLTASALATDREQFLGCGMDKYLTKPIHKETLKREILSCLEEKNTSFIM